MRLDSVIASHRLLVCVGPGGVGKTTTAAAIALRAAEQGRRALVLTIDPARRLSSALGLDGLDDAERPVEVRGLGSLHAAMLDTRSSFDALIHRIVRSPQVRRSIVHNRIYRAFSRTLARSHAYIAMERLLHATVSGAYDLVVLDTPPARSAMEILDAPDRLAQFLDENVLGSFVTGQSTSRLGRGAALGFFSTLAGRKLAGELLDFLTVFFDLRIGFAERAQATHQILRRDDTAFVLVSTADDALVDAARMGDELGRRELPVKAVIINRAYYPDGDEAVALPASPGQRAIHAALQPLGLPSTDACAALVERRWSERYSENALRQRRIDEFVRVLGKRSPKPISLADHDWEATSIEGLRRLLGGPT